jgi:hypothetical protein
MDAKQRHPPAVLVMILIASALFYLVFILRTAFRIQGTLYFTLIDDAMVSMRYAHHLVQGFGAVWNVGDQPVEGFTNPGWMFFMAFLHLLGIPAAKISLGVMIASAIFLLTNSYVVYKICEVLRPGSRYAPLIATSITAFYFPLVFWSLRGMEVGLLTLLIDLGVLTAFRFKSETQQVSSIVLCLVFFIAVLVRMDAMIQLFILSLYLVSRRNLDLRSTAAPLFVLILASAAILWLQRVYFGDFLPNTYYQKVVGASAWERIKNGILVFNQYATRDVLMLALFSLAGVIFYKELRSGETLLLASLFLVQCAYSIWVGGDYAEVEVDAANRFITQGMPALIILFSLAADYVLSDLIAVRQPAIQSKPLIQAAMSLGVALSALLVISGQPWVNWAIDNAPLLKADIRRVKLGLVLAEYTAPQATIAVHAAGQIPYYSERRTIDLLGLNDPVIAKGPVTGPLYPGHDKWNYDYSILQLKPDLIADNWVKLGDYMRDKSEYQELDNGIYVRKDSTLIDIDGLSKNFP